MNNESFFQSVQLLLNLMSEKRQNAMNRGEYYNIFEVLNLSTDEVRLHSMFIADLLNPNGKHGLGAKPLKYFIQILGLDFDEESICGCNVRREYVIGPISQDQTSGGNIDILLTIGNYLIIIENKIYAGDQPRQLLRYHNFAGSNPHTLVYLTLGGVQPSGSSTNGLVCSTHYTCISYRKDIARWIEQCLIMALSKPLIREILQQYLYIIKNLTDTIMEEDDKSKIFALMDKYPDVVLTIRKEDWYYRKHLVSKYVIEPFKEWCKERQYNCHIGFEFENQDRGVWFGMSFPECKKCLAVKFVKQDFQEACYGIGEPDINDPGSIVMSEMIAFEKYKSWSVDIAKDIISYKVLDYVCEKMEHLTTEIRLHPEKIL
ncbi:MAG: PD-(D/E)XK nuclease family protein [Muribaculaceae bacterium]|nr:PD-(D/E)XK nuclease family protein [Muribaculaceae bacterium]